MYYNLNTLVSHWRYELGGLSEEGWIRTEQGEREVTIVCHFSFIELTDNTMPEDTSAVAIAKYFSILTPSE